MTKTTKTAVAADGTTFRVAKSDTGHVVLKWVAGRHYVVATFDGRGSKRRAFEAMAWRVV